MALKSLVPWKREDRQLASRPDVDFPFRNLSRQIPVFSPLALPKRRKRSQSPQDRSGDWVIATPPPSAARP